MLLLSAMALGLVESTNPNTGDPIAGQPQLISTYDNETFKSMAPGDWTIQQCSSWNQPNHLYFQLGNAFFFLAFLAPHGSYGMLWLRCTLVIGCILITMWGWLIQCTGDIVLWGGLFLVTNIIYLIALVCKLRPVRFEKDIEAVSFFFFLYYIIIFSGVYILLPYYYFASRVIRIYMSFT